MKKKFFIGLALGYALGTAGGFALGSRKREIKAKFWQMKARARIDRRLAELTEFSRSAYCDIVDDVLEGFRDVSSIASADLENLRYDLKHHWREAKRRLAEDADEDEKE